MSTTISKKNKININNHACNHHMEFIKDIKEILIIKAY
jgi:hypothetical protein